MNGILKVTDQANSFSYNRFVVRLQRLGCFQGAKLENFKWFFY
ncbi:hypothetical protein GJA_2743 [Janthinobacterium agaricidamnosum NBRC 102515 = DSM 9628]|uniref:Uncharacterized protein n=1 Tax=Janthinobacterium agaricidamnosum NBRC 102515 = DSM 9628 TaxID=1349767 RepID=W0V3G6_9BURK|nr:hypothetical protein GJA_2743 [Janthinobacterium agaricidamnosum NBRC 102515 = DSM 9628]